MTTSGHAAGGAEWPNEEMRGRIERQASMLIYILERVPGLDDRARISVCMASMMNFLSLVPREKARDVMAHLYVSFDETLDAVALLREAEATTRKGPGQ